MQEYYSFSPEHSQAPVPQLHVESFSPSRSLQSYFNHPENGDVYVSVAQYQGGLIRTGKEFAERGYMKNFQGHDQLSNIKEVVEVTQSGEVTLGYAVDVEKVKNYLMASRGEAA